MSLFDAACEHADAWTSPSCHAVANALEGALDASSARSATASASRQISPASLIRPCRTS